jgi:hypothetical protein
MSTMSRPEEPDQTKKRLWITVIVIVVFSSLIIFLLYKNLSDEDQLRRSQVKEMREEINELNSSIKELSKLKRSLTKSRDSLQQNVDYIWPMRSLVYNAKLRDKVLADLELKPGDACRRKSDSSTVVITDVIVGGNQYTYFVNYRARNKKGETFDYSPIELEPLKKKTEE